MPIQSKSKKAAPAKPLYVAVFAKRSMTEAERARVSDEFNESGAKLVWVEYNQNYVKPNIEKMSR
jgi:hypothetical protein